VYNAAPSWGVTVGDALAVPDPVLTQHQHQHQGQASTGSDWFIPTFSFLGIRVSSPLSLVVNGKRPPGSALAPPRLALSNPSAPP
ncbi:TTC5 protein, partial [Toxostoma redivivum]|nr:TTC5 protein [Toxostoma redivivum]